MNSNYEDSISGMFDEAQSRVKKQQAEIERLQARCRELEASANEAQDARLRAVADATALKMTMDSAVFYVRSGNIAEGVTLIEKAMSKIEASAGADLLARLQQAEAERDAARKALALARTMAAVAMNDWIDNHGDQPSALVNSFQQIINVAADAL